MIKASKGARRVSKIFKRFGKGAKKIKPKWFKKAGKKAAPKGVGNSVKTLGRGSTGRTTANNLTEQLAMKEVRSNPLKGAESLNKIKMNDKRWPANKGWVKMQRVVIKKGKKIVIHFVYNTKTRKIDDFKFK